MTTRKLTNTEIEARIVPTHLRWPESGTTIAWSRLHECINALRDLALNAPPFLSGLNDTEFNLIRQRARTALHPEQSQMQDRLKKALAELQEVVAATKRMLLERCEMRENEDGQFRSIREPLTSTSLAPKATRPAA